MGGNKSFVYDFCLYTMRQGGPNAFFAFFFALFEICLSPLFSVFFCVFFPGNFVIFLLDNLL